MSNTATLVYTIAQTPPLSVAQLATAVAAVALPTSDMTNFGATLVSDETSVSGSNIIRTVVFNISSDAFKKNFPSATNQQASPFVNLYKNVLGGALGMTVVAAPPAIG
jgi:hypothetical protein